MTMNHILHQELRDHTTNLITSPRCTLRTFSHLKIFNYFLYEREKRNDILIQRRNCVKITEGGNFCMLPVNICRGSSLVSKRSPRHVFRYMQYWTDKIQTNRVRVLFCCHSFPLFSQRISLNPFIEQTFPFSFICINLFLSVLKREINRRLITGGVHPIRSD